MATIEKFAETFAKSKSAAAVGAQSFEPENQNVDTEVVDEEREVGLQQGISNATAVKFDVFLKENLSLTGQLFATILAKTHGGAFDSEFLLIASSEAASGAFSFAWADLFKGSLNGKAEEQVAGISVPLLRGACIQWIEHTQSQPTGADDASAIGDVDRTLTAAIPHGAAFDGEEMRVTTIARLNQLLDQKIVIENMSSSQRSTSRRRSLRLVDFPSHRPMATARKTPRARPLARRASQVVRKQPVGPCV